MYLNNGSFKSEVDPHQFNLRERKKIFKSWQVCDRLAKWLIVLGFMDLRWPRVYRRSNVGLVCWCWSECDVTSGTLAMAAIFRLFVDSQRLIARSQNRTKCVKYVLSYPTWPSRWVLCISMQWLRLMGCHVACHEWTSGEICSLQHMWVIGSVMWAAASGESLKFGGQGATVTNWFPRVNGAWDNGIWLYWHSDLGIF